MNLKVKLMTTYIKNQSIINNNYTKFKHLSERKKKEIFFLWCGINEKSI